MSRRFAAVVFVLALASCFGRVSAHAAEAPHACCAGESAPTGPALAECCAVPAVARTIDVVRGAVAAVSAAPFVVDVPSVVAVVVDVATAPSPQTYRSRAPARAPPPA